MNVHTRMLPTQNWLELYLEPRTYSHAMHVGMLVAGRYTFNICHAVASHGQTRARTSVYTHYMYIKLVLAICSLSMLSTIW